MHILFVFGANRQVFVILRAKRGIQSASSTDSIVTARRHVEALH